MSRPKWICLDCEHEETEPFNLCPTCTDKERADLQASAAEAHLHIDTLHALIKSGDLDTAQKVMNDWEADQCQF